jgi:hypothetical protein
MLDARTLILDTRCWSLVSGVRKGWKNNSGIQGKGYEVRGSELRVRAPSYRLRVALLSID